MDASAEKIISVKAHPNADRLELVQVLGYQCVTQKGLYSKGDIVVYIRPDAVLPQEAWAEDYRKYSPKRIKAVKLRGEWSEGIIVPLDLISHKFDFGFTLTDQEGFSNILGNEISEILGVTHYEPPIPQDLSAKGGLPFQIPKTDEKRWEELEDKGKLPFYELVDLSLKIDGQSQTVFYNVETKEFGVTGRSYEFKEDTTNNYTANVEKLGIREKLIKYCEKYNVSLALRGESYGSGIQGSKNNPHSKEKLGFAAFSVYNITEREYMHKDNLHYFVNACAEMDIPTVPMIEEDVKLTKDLILEYSSGLDKLNGNYFEGVVVKHANGSFKIINKNYDSRK